MATGQFGQILFETDIGTFKGFSAGLILKLSNLIPDFDFHVGIEHSIDFSLINPIKEVTYEVQQFKKLFGVEYVKSLNREGHMALGGKVF